MSGNAEKIKRELRKFADANKAKILSGFFKTGKGHYGEGDVFLGITVPVQRKIAREFKDSTSLLEIEKLLHSKIHEERLTALLILVYQMQKADELLQKKIYNFYLKNTRCINNWDLVDVTCRDIVGRYLYERDRAPLYKLAHSKKPLGKTHSYCFHLLFHFPQQF